MLRLQIPLWGSSAVAGLLLKNATRVSQVALYAILAAAFLCFGQEDELFRLYTEAREAQSRGDFRTATEKYQRIVTLRPDMAEVHSNLGSLYYQQKQFSEASRHFRKAIDLKPSLGAPHFFLGVISVEDHKFDEAVQHLKRALALGVPESELNLPLGYAFFGLSRYELAARHFERVAEDPTRDHLDALFFLSKAYARLADKYFADLKEKFAGSYFFHLARAHAFEIEEKWEKARIEYDEALRKDPDNDRLREKLAWVARKETDGSLAPEHSGSMDEIVDGQLKFFYHSPAGDALVNEFRRSQGRIRQLLKEEGRSAKKFYLLGERYQVVSYLASLSVVASGPTSHRAYELRGQDYERIGKNDEAIQEYRRALELKPDLKELHFRIGNLYWKRDRLEEALPELQKEIAVNPNHPHALYEIGDILYAQGNLEAAEKYFLRSLKANATTAETRLALEKIYSNWGQYDRALAQLRDAAEVAPKDSTPHYRMWVIYRRLGKNEEAAAAINTFRQLKAQEDAAGDNE